MALRIYDAAMEAAVDALVDLADGGSVRVYAGTRPALNGGVGGATLLATLDLAATAFGAASSSGGVSTASGAGLPITQDDANATGTATWAALLDSSDGILYTGTVGVGSGDFQLESLDIVADQEVRLTALSFSLPQDDS